MLTIPDWITPRQPPEAPDACSLHIWRIEVEYPGMNLNHLLSGDEQQRSLQMLSVRDQTRFSNARGGLRAILAAYLKCSPQSIRFNYGPKGKPQLDQSVPLHFNLTHAGNLALLAISSNTEIGIDLEQTTRRNNLRSIARRVFDPDLCLQLDCLDETTFDQAFFLHWTQMEARVKSLGQGVFTRDSKMTRVQCINFTPQPGWCAAVAAVKNLPAQDQWQMLQFTPDLFSQLG